MNLIARELDDAIGRMDKKTALAVERIVRDALMLAATKQAGPEWPVGYFEATSGAFADESFERPPQGPLPIQETW